MYFSCHLYSNPLTHSIDFGDSADYMGLTLSISGLYAAFSVNLLLFVNQRERIAWSQAIINHLAGPQGTAVAFSHEYFTTQQIQCKQSEKGITNYWEHALLPHLICI